MVLALQAQKHLMLTFIFSLTESIFQQYKIQQFCISFRYRSRVFKATLDFWCVCQKISKKHCLLFYVTRVTRRLLFWVKTVARIHEIFHDNRNPGNRSTYVLGTPSSIPECHKKSFLRQGGVTEPSSRDDWDKSQFTYTLVILGSLRNIY